jgi:hypothetical protein
LALANRVAASKTSDTAAAAPLRGVVHSHHIPIFAEADAVHRVRDDAVPFVFFTDKATGRGRLLDCRYDANLGLITPIGNTSQSRTN